MPDRRKDPFPEPLSAADSGRFADVTGDRMALLGRETGPFELWMWPLELVSELALELAGDPAEAELAVAVRPGALHRRRTQGGLTLDETLVASPDRRALIWVLELSGPRAAALELSCRCVLRPQWPAGLGGQMAGIDPDTGALCLCEELGRFAALLGGVGFECDAGPLDRGLPPEPVRFRARLEPGERRAFLVAGAQLAPRPLAAGARLGQGQAARGEARARHAVQAARELWHELLPDGAHELERSRARWKGFLQRVAQAHGSDPCLNEAFRAALLAIERAWVEVDGLGRGLVAGLAESGESGRPGYGWIFDGDALVAARALAAAGDGEGSRAVLRGAASRQREDGKLMHELVLSAGLVDWTGDYPYAYYKGLGAADFAITLDRHVQATGEVELARELREPLRRAIEWCASTTDEAGRMSNRLAGIAAVEAGPLSDAIESEVFLQGAWMGALAAARRLARHLGDESLQARATELAARAAHGFETFWSERRGRYGFARLQDGSLQDDLTAYVAYPLALGLGHPARAARTLPWLNHPSLTADWGPRMFASDSAVYDPHDYNTGAVFPYLANFAILALYRGGRSAQALQLYRALLALTGTSGQGLVPEHLCGDRFGQPARGVPHQIFSSSAVIESLLAGALGLEPGGPEGTLRIEPRLPLPAREIEIARLPCGTARGRLRVSSGHGDGASRVSVSFETLSGAPPKVRPGALLPPGSQPLGARAPDGREVAIETLPGPASTLRVLAREPCAAFELRYRSGPVPDLGAPELVPGQESRAPRLVGGHRDARGVAWELFGRAGTQAAIPISCDRRFACEGERTDGERIVVRFPPGQGFTRRVVRLGLEDS